jgi:preprotein translocase subunit SecY
MKRSAWRFLWKSEDIRKKLLITLGILIVFRLAANIPAPGVNRAVIESLVTSDSAASSLLGLLDMLAGGTISHFSILAMSVYPYITAQIILQLLAPIIPALERRMKENPREGQKFMDKWTMILTVPMALLSAFGQINIFTQLAGGQSVLDNYGFTGTALLPTLATLISMVAGTMLGVWLGQLISEFGIPNQGLSLIIFAGIVSQIGPNLLSILRDQTNWWWMLILVLAILFLTVFTIVFVQQGRRNVPVLFPGRRIGNRQTMPVRSSLPLMVNMAGMIPLIFAQSLLTFPAILASFFQNSQTEWVANLANGIADVFSGSSVIYAILYILMVFGFTFFYTDVLFQQQNYGDNLKRQGAKVPGITAGPQTQNYLNKVQRRITLPGAVFLGVVAGLPYILRLIMPITGRYLFLISAAGLLIVVGVVRDTFNIIDAELKLHGYQESLLKG